MNEELLKNLVNVYPVISSSVDGDTVIRIDDRPDSDKDGLYADIFVRISADNRATLELHRTPFVWDLIGAWIESHGGTVSGQGSTRLLNLSITESDGPLLRSLASQFRQLGDSIPVQHRVVPIWKYICPRIARSLEPLAEHLEDFSLSQFLTNIAEYDAIIPTEDGDQE